MTVVAEVFRLFLHSVYDDMIAAASVMMVIFVEVAMVVVVAIQ